MSRKTKPNPLTMAICDWCMGNGLALDGTHPCLECGGIGVMPPDSLVAISRSTEPLNGHMLVPWKEAYEWWGEGLVEFLLEHGWRADQPGPGWRPGIEPIFWETVQAACGGFRD